MTTAAKPQHLEALEKGNRIRLGRAMLKRRIFAGQATVAEAIPDHAELCATMTVHKLLQAQHLWGAKRSSRFLNSIGMTQTRKVGDLTDREKIAVIGGLAC